MKDIQTISFPYEALEQGKGKAEGDIFGNTIVEMGKDYKIPTPFTDRMRKRIEERFSV